MPYCPDCRSYLDDTDTHCPKCGKQNPKYSGVNNNTYTNNTSYVPPKQNKFIDVIKALLKTDDYTYEYDSADISQNSNFAIMAYLGPLVIVPILVARKSKFAMFHFCQGLLNLVTALIYCTLIDVLANILPSLLALVTVVPATLLIPVFPIFCVVGIINVVKHKATTLPLHGRLNIMSLLFKNL